MPATYRVVTHIHSNGSHRLANRAYPLISSFLASLGGPAAANLPWFECGTTIADIETILAGRRTRKRVDVLFLTDHMSAQWHVISEEALALARRCRRFGVGAEVQTVLPDGAGGWADAPEVLLYGPAAPMADPCGEFHGISQAWLDEMYERCTPPGAPAPDILAVQRFCDVWRVACALAHPLDGHGLSLPQLLTLIALFDVVEAVNGGYSRRSGRLLQRLLAARRRENERRAVVSAAAGQGGEGGAPRTPLPAALALGGSDAHLDDFDRVVTLFRAARPPTAGDVAGAMLAARLDPEVARERFAIEGRGIGRLTLYREVATLVARNVRRLRPHLPGLALPVRLLQSGLPMAAAELRRMDRAAARLHADLEAWLDAEERGLTEAPWPLASDLGRRPHDLCST